MKISGLQKLSLQDFPGCMSAIVFVSGCNFRCPFCHNGTLVDGLEPEIPHEEVLDYLKLRKNILGGVVISGGEPLIYPDLIDFIKEVREIGYRVKLDTNGLNHKALKELIDNNLLDYIAMDIKNDFDHYDTTCGLKVDIENIKTSINLIKSSKIPHEFRTTVCKEFHSETNLEKIGQIVGDDMYFIQNFENSDGVFDHTLTSFNDLELENLLEAAQKYAKNSKIRGK